MDKPPSLRSYFTLTDISTVKVNCLTDRQTDRHQYNGLFSRTTWVSRHQKGEISLDFNEARDDGLAVASVVPYASHLHLTQDS